MMNSRLLAGAAIAAITLIQSNSYAGVIDFEDLSLGTSANVGASMTSGGVDIDMQSYLWSSGTSTSSGHADIITAWSGTSFGNNQVFYPNNINAVFDFAGTVGQQAVVTIPYHDGGGNVNFLVNPALGGSIINVGDFTDAAIDGATINGVSVSVSGTYRNGVITLAGPIDQVLIGGQEVLLDDIYWGDSLNGDLNGDGYVGLDDLDIILNNWNKHVVSGNLAYGDVSGDGFVGLDDLDIVLNNWNNGTPPTPSAIPEPASGLLFVLASMCVARRSKP